MGYFDEATGLVLLVAILIVILGYIVYLLAVGASYVLVAILGVLYTALAILGSVALAGLDFLLCPAQLASIPWAAWAAWGGLAGAAAGFWTVAPVYGLRRLRPALLLLTPVALVVVLALRLIFGPPLPAPAVQVAAPAPSPPQPVVHYAIPIRFEGLSKPKNGSEPQQINISLNHQLHSCADTSTGPPIDQPAVDAYNYPYDEPAVAPLHRFIGIQLNLFSQGPAVSDPPLVVRLQPSLSGAAGTTTYWNASTERGGYLIWFLDRQAMHVLFTLVVEPRGDYRFVDGTITGQGESSNGPHEYAIAQHSGVLGMSRTRQSLKVDWLPAGFRRNDGEAVSKYGIGFGNITFPEGELVLDLTQ